MLIHQDISTLLSKFLADDSYYSFEIAKNIIEGRGIVFNYGIPTNGFHPLYTLGVLVPLFKIFHGLGLNAPIYASLIAITIINIGTSIVLFLILRRLLDKRAGILGTFIWLFNPYVLFVSFIGLESSLQIFAISLLVCFLLKRGGYRFSFKESAIVGLLMGLVFLSRLDGVFLALGFIVVATMRQLKTDHNPFGLLKRFDLFSVVIVALLVASPWLIWNYMELGRLTPISGDATKFLASLNLSDKSYIGLVKHSIFSTVGFAVKFFFQIVDTTKSGILVLVLGFLPTTILLIKRDRLLLNSLIKLDFLVLGSFFYFVFYWFYQLGIREWYSVYTSFLLTILFSFSIIRLVRIYEPNKVWKLLGALLVCILVVAFVVGGLKHYQRGNFPQEKLKWEVANYIDSNIPSNKTIGSFNTGIYQYYTAEHDVINLDGVMSPEALKAMKSNSIESYILQKHIDYIIDRPGYAQRVNQSLIKFDPIETFELHYNSYKVCEGLETVVLFRVTPS